MYFDGQYYAALHLSGATDEIFIGYVTRSGTDSAFESMKAGALRIAKHLAELPDYQMDASSATDKRIAQVMNYARNRRKHLDTVGDGEILFAPNGRLGTCSDAQRPTIMT